MRRSSIDREEKRVTGRNESNQRWRKKRSSLTPATPIREALSLWRLWVHLHRPRHRPNRGQGFVDPGGGIPHRSQRSGGPVGRHRPDTVGDLKVHVGAHPAGDRGQWQVEEGGEVVAQIGHIAVDGAGRTPEAAAVLEEPLGGGSQRRRLDGWGHRPGPLGTTTTTLELILRRPRDPPGLVRQHPGGVTNLAFPGAEKGSPAGRRVGFGRVGIDLDEPCLGRLADHEHEDRDSVITNDFLSSRCKRRALDQLLGDLLRHLSTLLHS
jgi:hypothetical protein